MRSRTLIVGLSVLASLSLLATPASWTQGDLDAFMAAVLERRDENWKKTKQYILDEREVVQVRGPGRIPVWGDRREFTWYMRDGFFVRSPLKANGVDVSEADRVKYEEEFFAQAKRREEREKEKEAAANAGTPDPQSPPPMTDDGLLADLRRPQFIDQAYFLDFKFEAGTYAFVGRETFEGREVLRIEYYPASLFSNEPDERGRHRDRSDDALERMMNKVALVTIWVEPASKQIVKYTFDNVNLDFLPVAWLARVTDLTAVMTMSQPFPDVWLPRDIEFYFGVLVAVGSFDVRYRLDYHDYREAVATARIKRSESR